MASNNHWLNWPLERFPAEFHTALAQGKPDHPILLEWPARWKARYSPLRKKKWVLAGIPPIASA